MYYLDIFGVEYGFCRSAKCSYKDKWNRAVKLASMFEELSRKFDGIAERGNYCTDNARLALACKMMLYTGIRIGNEDSAEGYMTKPHPYSKKEPEFVKTYGLTTLLREHLTFKRGKLYVHFLGKKQVDNYFVVEGDLARQVRAMVASHNGETAFGVTDYELTKFIKRYVGRRFTPKDFRTMRANMYAYDALSDILERENPHTKREFNAEVKEIATYVSEKLNNTPGVCKKSYIDGDFWSEFSELRPIIK